MSGRGKGAPHPHAPIRRQLGRLALPETLLRTARRVYEDNTVAAPFGHASRQAHLRHQRPLSLTPLWQKKHCCLLPGLALASRPSVGENHQLRRTSATAALWPPFRRQETCDAALGGGEAGNCFKSGPSFFLFLLAMIAFVAEAGAAAIVSWRCATRGSSLATNTWEWLEMSHVSNEAVFVLRGAGDIEPAGATLAIMQRRGPSHPHHVRVSENKKQNEKKGAGDTASFVRPSGPGPPLQKDGRTTRVVGCVKKM